MGSKCLTDLNTSIKEKEAKVYFENLPTVYARKSEIKLLFQNLISNAIKFSKKEEKPEIFVQYSLGSKEHKLHVQDNGLGIEQEFQEKIFLPFNRLHSKAEIDGTGIGLANCKKIVE